MRRWEKVMLIFVTSMSIIIIIELMKGISNNREKMYTKETSFIVESELNKLNQDDFVKEYMLLEGKSIIKGFYSKTKEQFFKASWSSSVLLRTVILPAILGFISVMVFVGSI